MARFPIQRAPERLGTIPPVRANIDVDTGEQLLAEAVAGFGGAIANLGLRFYNIQAATQLSKAKRLAVEEMNRLSLSFEGNLDPETYLKEYEKSLKAIQASTGAVLTNRRANADFGLFLNDRQPRWENDVKKAQKARVKDNWMAELFDRQAGVEQSGIYGDFSKYIAKGVAEGMIDRSDGVKAIIQTKKSAERGIINQFIRNGNINSAFEAIQNAKTLTPQEKTSFENSVTNRALQLRNLSNEAFDDRAGQATEGWFKSLEEGTLTDDEIVATDLQAVGEQKTSEVTLKRQWQKILRDTIKLTEPLISNESVYDSLVVGSEQVERGTKSPAEWDLEYAQAWANGDLEKEDRRGLRTRDIVATKTMQNRAFSESTTNNLSRLVELRDDELSGLITARDNALKIKDLKTVNALNFSIKKAQIQKWNYGRFRTELRSQIAQNENWSQKQIFAAADILTENYDKPVADLMLEFEKANPNKSILKTSPDIEFKDIWKDLPDEDKAKVWELRLMGVPVKEILGAI